MLQSEKRWQLPSPVSGHALPGDIPAPIVQVLIGRGIDTAEKLHLFLGTPHMLPYNPLRLSGMELALRRLYQAIERGEKVGIFGDFDVDGLTGTAIVAGGLKAFGVSYIPYLPHRVDEGHGLSAEAIRQLSQEGVSLIVTVDCGVTSVAEVNAAGGSGIDVIITDHHTPATGLPAASAIINPRISGNKYPFLELSGAGLAFKLVQGLFQYYGQPWDQSLLELAALGTIADLVPLVDENRFLVSQGLERLSRTQRPGLQALFRWSGVQPESINVEAASFQVIPRLNSSGRMGHAMDSFLLLTTESPEEAESLAERLEKLNQERRDLTERAFAAADQLVQGQSILPSILLVEDQTITPGVAGLVAGRLVERYRRPAIVMSSTSEDYVVASARSIPGFNLIEALTTCESLFVRYGGHAQAAGFTLLKERIPRLTERLTGIADERLSSQDLQPLLQIDAEIKLADLGKPLFQWLRQLEPFGPGNTQPTFLTRGAEIAETQFVGQQGQHMKLRVRDRGQEWTALAFNQAKPWVNPASGIDLVYAVTTDSWNGSERITLKILDARPPADGGQ
jgi:single-stranded-DNA-specific exonuclease